MTRYGYRTKRGPNYERDEHGSQDAAGHFGSTGGRGATTHSPNGPRAARTGRGKARCPPPGGGIRVAGVGRSGRRRAGGRLGAGRNLRAASLSADIERVTG